MLYKPKLTSNDAKQHLHDIRYQRQKELAFIIDECHQIRMKHRQIFDNQFNSRPTEKVFFKENQTINQENDLSDVQEFTEYLSESSLLFPDNQRSNTRILSPKRKTGQRCSSVSSVASADKRANRIYEKWPDYTEISRIVGYCIEKIPPIQTSSTPPVLEINPKKRKKTTRFANAAKQVKDMSVIERETLKNQPVIESPIIPIIDNPIKINEPKLPSILCPSSKTYSKRIQTRQWLIKHSFSPQTLPLI